MMRRDFVYVLTIIFVSSSLAEGYENERPRILPMSSNTSKSCVSTFEPSAFTLAGATLNHSIALPRLMAYEPECFRVQHHNATYCLPSWIILGAPKSATSALWNFLCQDTLSHRCGQKKELHFTDVIKPRKSLEELLAQTNTGYANGFALLHVPNDIKEFLLSSSCVKFLFLLRNPIMWVYSAWHFWCNPLLDGPSCTQGEWAIKFDQNGTSRTPQSFHEFLLTYCVPTEAELSTNPMTLVPTTWASPRCPLNWPWGLWEKAKMYRSRLGQNLLLLRTEELQESPSQTMATVYNFLSLPEEGLLAQKDRYEQAYNVGSDPGVAVAKSLQKALGHSYQSMLPESIKLLCRLIRYPLLIHRYSASLKLTLQNVDREVCNQIT